MTHSIKKTALLLCFIFAIVQVNAQFTMVANGAEVNDNDIFTFAANEQELSVKITNNSDISQQYVFEVMELTNTDGSGFQICISSCYMDIAVGDVYPPRNEAPLTLDSGATTADNLIHFLNTNAGDGTNYPMDYVFRLYEVDADGEMLGTPLNFTYRYDPTISGIDDNTIPGVKVSQLWDEHSIIINAPVTLTSAAVFDVQGRLVINQALDSNSCELNLSRLNGQVFVLVCTDDKGNTFTQKVIKP